MSAPPPVSPFTTAVEHLRATTRWTVAAFAGVAAILVAGSQLSSLGRLNPDQARFWWAIVGATVALIGVASALVFALRVQGSGRISLRELVAGEEGADRVWWSREAQFVHAHPSMLGGYPKIRDLADAQDKAVADQKTAWEANDRAKLEKAAGDLEYLDRLITQLLQAVRYDMVDRAFGRSAWWLFVSGGIAAVALVVFAWAANPAPPSPQAFRVPVEGTVTLTEDGRDALRRNLGEACVEQPVRVIVLRATEERTEMVSIPTPECKIHRFTIGENGYGHLAPTTPVR